jgi:dTMP kinase
VTGRFIVFEGGEATGKSTQAHRLAERLDAVLTHQPGGTELGRAIRGIVLDPANTSLDPRAEALLIAADKAQHVAEIVRPALAAGRHVVCDRYIASSIVYQGHGRGIDLVELDAVLQFATGGLEPDLTVLLEVADHVAEERLGDQRDRFEAESSAFHARVRAGYRSLATAHASSWAVVDATGTVDEVAARVAAVVAARLAVSV